MRELHLHLDGSLRPKTVFELSKRENINLGNLEDVKSNMIVPTNCQSLNEYLEGFDLPLMFLQRPEYIERVSFELGEDLYNLGLEYGEIRFAPQSFTKGGLTQREVIKSSIKGIKKAIDKYKIKLGLILCSMRGSNNKNENLETLNLVSDYLEDVVCGFDLAGAEGIFPTSDYEDLFLLAKKKDLPFTIHAGEASGAESVWKALELGAKRIGHGVRSIEDPNLVEYLVKERITLEVCITSNFHTKLIEKIENHPIKALFDKGVRVTINSDNMTVSNTNIIKEMKIAKNILGFSSEDLLKINNYAKDAAFII